VALPEVFLGIPGWGGAWLLSNLIGIENALKVVIIENPLKNNRMLTGQEAFDLGIADANSICLLPRAFHRPGRQRDSWHHHGEARQHPRARSSAVKWDIAIGVVTKMLGAASDGSPNLPTRPLAAQSREEHDRATGFAAEGRGLPTSSPATSSSKHLRRHLTGTKRPSAPAGAPTRTFCKAGDQGRRDRSGSHGEPVRAALRAPAQGTRDHHGISTSASTRA
jgi:hypothetical protein